MTLTGPIAAVILPNVGGWAGGLITMKQVRPGGWYSTLDKPKWTPPNWVFGPAWTTLYCGMGYASYLVYEECGGLTEKAAIPLGLYGAQLALNWAWTPIFFHQHQIKYAFYEIVVLTGAAALCATSFFKVTRPAGLLMLPYLAWLGYAAALNYSVWKRNEGLRGLQDTINEGPRAKITEIVDDVEEKRK